MVHEASSKSMLMRASEMGESARLEKSGVVAIVVVVLILLNGPSFFPQPFGLPARRDFEYMQGALELAHLEHNGRSFVHLTLAAWQLSHDNLSFLLSVAGGDVVPVVLAVGPALSSTSVGDIFC